MKSKAVTVAGGSTPRPDRALVQAFSIMTTVCFRLQISSCFKDAWSLYKKAKPLLSKRGYNHVDVRASVSVCLYLAILVKGKLPRKPLEDLFDAVRFINPHGMFLKEKTRNMLKLLVQDLGLELMDAPYNNSSSNMKRQSVLLGMGRLGFLVAMEVMKKIEKEFSGLRSDVLEASCLLVAAENIPVFDICIITGVNEETIHHAHQRIRAFLTRKADHESRPAVLPNIDKN